MSVDTNSTATSSTPSSTKDSTKDTSTRDTVRVIDDLTDSELTRMVHDLQDETKRMELENQIFENFLKASEPSLISAMATTLEAVRKMQQASGKPSQRLPSVPSATTDQTGTSRVPTVPSTPRTMSKTSVARSDASEDREVRKSSIQSSHEKGPRINISQKTDLVMREIEETQNSLGKFVNISHRKKNKLKAEIEESTIRAQEVNESRDSFEREIVVGAREKITQKIPAEKYVRYMQEWLKSAQFMLEKLRLRTSSLRIHANRLKALLNQKEELGECVHEVDFEKLKIENKNFQIKMDQKNHHLLELKHINARANLMLTSHKKILEKKGEQLKVFRKNLQNTQKKIVDLEEESALAQAEVKTEHERYLQLKKLRQLYRVPDVMEYIHRKAELHELQKTLKIWKRKRNIQKISLSTYTKMMMHMTNAKRPKPSWYDPNKSVDILELEEYYTRNFTYGRSYSRDSSYQLGSVMSIDILGYRDQKAE